MLQPDRNSYFVATELYRRGYSVAATLGNTKAIDLLAESDTCTVNVPVKSIRTRQSIGWVSQCCTRQLGASPIIALIPGRSRIVSV
jgi:hypothetical protein